MRILSLEGAPCRSVGQIEVMKRMMAVRKTDFHSDFDLYLGSSWGAVMSLCLAHQVPLEEMESAFIETQNYLNATFHRILSLFLPRMCPVQVLKPFEKFFQKTTLKELKHRVICHGYDIQKKRIITFDSHKKECQDLLIEDLLPQLIFAPSLYKPHGETSMVDASLAMRNPLYFSLIQLAPQIQKLEVNVLHIGIGQKKPQSSRVRQMFQKGWIHWVFSKQIFDEIESIGRSYHHFLVESLVASSLFPLLKVTSIDPQIEGDIDFSFMGDMTLTVDQIRKEVTGWMEQLPIDHFES